MCKKPSTVQLTKRLDYSNILGLNVSLKNGRYKGSSLLYNIMYIIVLWVNLKCHRLVREDCMLNQCFSMSFVSSMNPIYHNHNFVLCDEVIGPLHINLILLDFSLICTIFIVFISPFVVLSETISFEKKTLLVICLFLICKIDMSLFATGTVGNLVFLRVMFEFAQLSILPSLVRHT